MKYGTFMAGVPSEADKQKQETVRPPALVMIWVGNYLLTRTTRKREMLQKSSMLSIWMLSVPSSSSTMV